MKFENIYVRSVLALIVTIFCWFWAAPTCFNWNPLVGAIAFVLPPVLVYWIIVKPLIKKYKQNQTK